MSTPFAECAQEVRRLSAALGELDRQSRLLVLPPLEGREWYELLTRKLLPQLFDEPFIVVAVVGGTNIGKSVIFNHLAGCQASAISPLASGTKHPVCLVPPGFALRHNLQEIFQGFELHEWTRSEAALEDHPRHQLFWRTSPQTPANLLVLDTPDIDSDAPVNWLRADCVRHCADVLIAVLTQQKYNDAAVKQFFRKAAAEDKAVILVFNQCQLPDDERYWPLWLETFSRETGIQPDLVYLAPNDRRAADENRLPFYPREWPVPIGRNGAAAGEGAGPAGAPAAAHDRTAPPAQPENLARALSTLHFDDIKFRTIRGALRHLNHPQHGIPAWLDEIKGKSADFRAASDVLAAHRLAEIRDWPVIPNDVLVTEIRDWWRLQREGWTRSVHDFYNSVGQGLMLPFRWAKERVQGPQHPPLDVYRQAEWNAILETIERVYEKLAWICELGNVLLKPRLEALLAGASRAELLERIGKAHAELPLAAEVEQVVRSRCSWARRAGREASRPAASC